MKIICSLKQSSKVTKPPSEKPIVMGFSYSHKLLVIYTQFSNDSSFFLYCLKSVILKTKQWETWTQKC